MLMGFITAEALYPGTYSTHANTVSHLGASEPPDSVVLQPSAAIFDITMLVTGAMILAGAFLAHRALRSKAVLVPTALLGLGCLGVGFFPLTHPTPFLEWGPVAELGEGGIERWIVYPVVLWLVAFGSWLMATQDPAREEMVERAVVRRGAIARCCRA